MSWKVSVSTAAIVLSSFAQVVGAQEQESQPEEQSAAPDDAAANAEVRARFDAAPDDAAGFGEARQWAFSSDAALSLQRTTLSDVDGATTTVTLAPAADYFVIRNLSVGGVVGLTYSKTGENTSTRFTLGPRVGYNLGISRVLSIWPKVGFSFAHTNSKVETEVAGMKVSTEVDSNAIALNLFVPIMLHPAPHFFAGFGPFLDTDLSGDNQSTTWGLKLTLGGWL
jgi:hypothetical protein